MFYSIMQDAALVLIAPAAFKGTLGPRQVADAMAVGARRALRATTRGVGELVWEAVERGAKTVVVGLGGSATVDGGTGAARGLGWSFLDSVGASLPEGGGSLTQLAEFDGGWGIAARVIALADVTTPLVGSRGAAPVFGPQKGAGPEGVKLLSRGLERLAELMARHGRGDLATLPGG